MSWSTAPEIGGMTEARWRACVNPYSLLRHLTHATIWDAALDGDVDSGPWTPSRRLGTRRDQPLASTRKLRLVAAAFYWNVAAAADSVAAGLGTQAAIETETWADGTPPVRPRRAAYERPEDQVGRTLSWVSYHRGDRTFATFGTDLVAIVRSLFDYPHAPAPFSPAWRTRTVLDVAGAVYSLRGTPCPACRGPAAPACDFCDYPAGSPTGCPPATCVCARPCRECDGHGRVGHWGCLDPERLAVLHDALLDAGVPERVACRACGGDGLGLPDRPVENHNDMPPCPACAGRGVRPHPVLENLRAPGPYYRGLWAIDAALGRN